MERMVQSFKDFLGEELNYMYNSNEECHLTRGWYYYESEDDIVYGSDERPAGRFPIVFSNDSEDWRLMSLNLENLRSETYTGADEIEEYLYENGFDGNFFEIEDDSEEISNFFELFENQRFILLHGTRLVASTLDIIEEN